MGKWDLLFTIFVAFVGFLIWTMKGKIPVEKSLDLIRVRIGTKKEIPDPANIMTTGDWYFLDHISSGLVSYDHERNLFTPNIAEKWKITDKNIYLFKLRKDLQFSDGTLITPSDVERSLKRLLIKKSSTHLPLWNYIIGCDSLKSIEEYCSGLIVNSDGDLEISLKTRSESFFLQLASPETGIWSKSDIDTKNLTIKPTKYSGPYKVSTITEKGVLIERNENSLVSQKFPNSPKKIELISMPIIDAENELRNGSGIDLVLRSHNPFAEKNGGVNKIQAHKTAPCVIVYFYSVHHNQSIKLVGQDFMRELWKKQADEAIAADTFLPFASNYSLKTDEYLMELPAKSAKTIRIAKPWNYYSDDFIQLLIDTAKNIDVDLKIVEMSSTEWLDAFKNPKASQKVDFILSPYVASDRYPAVQLRFITGTVKKSSIDLSKAETPDLTSEKIEILKKYQKWLLQTQSAIPLFFTRMHIYHKENIDLGVQSKTDGEVELWRLKVKN